MRGHIRKKGNNWYVILELDRDAEGNRQQRTLSVRKELGLAKPATKPQAERLLISKLKELHDGIYIEPQKMTLSSWLNQWLNDHGRNNLRKTTYESYESFIRLHVIPSEIGRMELHKIRPMHINKLLADKLKSGRADGKPGGLHPRSVKYIHTILHEALKHAVKLEIIPRNVAEAVTPPKEIKPEIQAWTAEQVHAFMEVAADHRLYPLFLLALTTGMRRGELLGLRWKDIDWRRKTLSVRQTLVVTKDGIEFQEPKTDAGKRVIALDDDVMEVLKFWRTQQMNEADVLGWYKDEAEAANQQPKEPPMVFCSIAGTPMNPRNLSRAFESLIKSQRFLRLHCTG